MRAILKNSEVTEKPGLFEYLVGSKLYFTVRHMKPETAKRYARIYNLTPVSPTQWFNAYTLAE